jgi:hypothetical protein
MGHPASWGRRRCLPPHLTADSSFILHGNGGSCGIHCSGAIADGYIWGRGALDVKVSIQLTLMKQSHHMGPSHWPAVQHPVINVL